jgi:hypothetical protein
MRVRRELARVVGRASAIAAFVWLRRPLRAQAMAAAAFTGVLAATVFSGSPAVSVTTAMPPTSAPTLEAPIAVAMRPVASVVRLAPVGVRHVYAIAPARRHRPAVQRVCAPASAPGGAPQGVPQTPTEPTPPDTNPIVGGVLGITDGTMSDQGWAPTVGVTVPTAHTTDDGCVEVGT